ncbi:unnamed protein product [Parajaminaea phylloscopi]
MEETSALQEQQRRKEKKQRKDDPERQAEKEARRQQKRERKEAKRAKREGDDDRGADEVLAGSGGSPSLRAAPVVANVQDGGRASMAEQPSPPGRVVPRPPHSEQAPNASLSRPIQRNPFMPVAAIKGAPPPFYPSPVPRPAGFDASLFPPNMNMSAIEAQIRKQGSSAPVQRRGATAADLEAAIASTAGSSRNGGGRTASLTTHKSSGGGTISKSKEATLADAQGLTERQILTEKLYQPHQLQWLQEGGLLKTLHKGKFSAEERQKMEAAFEAFGKRRNMQPSEVSDLLTSREKDHVETYAALTQEVAASVEGRSLRAVRRYVLETFNPAARQGSWTYDQRIALVAAVQKLGSKWVAIGSQIGRLPRDCRTRWRDHGESDRALYEADRAGDESLSRADETQRSESTPTRGWTVAEITLLRETVAAVCAEMKIDVASESALPWSVIASKVGSRAPSSCRRKWEEMQSQLKRGFTDADIAENRRADGKISWVSARDDVALVARLLQQERALQENDENLIDWAVVPSDELPFAQNELSKAWRRLKRKHEEGKGSTPSSTSSGAATQDKTLAARLKQLEIVVQDRRRAWEGRKERSLSRANSTDKDKSGWSQARRQAHEIKKRTQELLSPNGSPTKRKRTASSLGAEDPQSPSKRKGSGRGGAFVVDLGDVIGSSEDEDGE